MVFKSDNKVVDVYYGSNRIQQINIGQNMVYGFNNFVPKPEYPNDPHLNGIRFRLEIDEEDSAMRRIYLNGTLYNGEEMTYIEDAPIDFGDGTTSETPMSILTDEFGYYHQYENGSFTMIIDGHWDSIEGGAVGDEHFFMEVPAIGSHPEYIDEKIYNFNNVSIKEVYIGDDVGVKGLDYNSMSFQHAVKLRMPNTLEHITGDFNKLLECEVVDLRNCEKLHSIFWYSFQDCENLTKVIFPKNLSYIEYDAFFNCRQLNSVVFTGDNGCEYWLRRYWEVDTAFEQCGQNLTFYVRDKCLDFYDYRTGMSGWNIPTKIEQVNRGLFDY